MCHTTIVIRATRALFQQFDNEIYHWMVVFSGFYESHGPPPLGDAHGIVPSHRYGHQNGQQSGHILHLCFVCCHPGGRRGNTEGVVAGGI